MEPVHQAAFDGDLASINQLIAEDGGRLNAQVQQNISLEFDESDLMDEYCIQGCTPLILASWRGHDAVVVRLLALGADMGLRDVYYGELALNWPCCGNRASIKALLLDAGTPMNDRSEDGHTILMLAAMWGATESVALLLARGGDVLDVDARKEWGSTALHIATAHYRTEVVKLLLQAGADPTISNTYGTTALDYARSSHHQPCVALLEAAMAEPQRPRLLLKARALLDSAHKIRQARAGNTEQGDDGGLRRSARLAPERNALAAAPPYLKGRVQQGQPLPRVEITGQDEELTACLKYALGLEGGGGVHEGPGLVPQGMLPEVFVELCELLVPKWDHKHV